MVKSSYNFARILLSFSVLVILMGSSISAQTSIFTNQVPINSGNDSDYELGTKFISTESASVNAIRFYKMPGETGLHTGSIWSADGNLLTSVLFSSESASGWQSAQLTTPLIIIPNTIYIVSVNTNSIYPIEQNMLSTSITSGFLSTVADGNNGVFNETPGNFPTQSYNNSSYFIDISAAGLNSIFTTQLPLSEFNDGPYELGVKFTVSQAALAKNIRYYKMSGETGNHTGNLWTSAGTLLAAAQFINETSTGWQSAQLNSTVYLIPGNTYVVSVNSNTTYAASEQQALASPITNGILSTVADNNNGVYSGSPNSQGVFPTSSYNNVNYFRDIAVEPISAPAIPALISPADNSTGNSIETLLQWSTVSGAVSYSLQAATDSLFSSKIIDLTNLTSTSYQLSGLTNNQKYFWRVSAENQIISSGFQTVNKFTTIANGIVALNWPTGGIYLYSTTPALSWSVPSGGFGWKFDLLYSLNSDMSSPAIISNITNYQQTISNLLPGTIYYWQIKLKTSNGNAVSYSGIESFLSFGKAVTPYASWPTWDAVVHSLSPTLYWYLPESGIDISYEVELKEGLPNTLTNTPTAINIAAQNYAAENLESDKTYSWQVRSKSGSNYSDWSIPATFKTYAVGTAIIPKPSWPLGEAIIYTTSPSLHWYLGADGTGLNYQIELVEGFTTPFSGTPTIINITGLFTLLNELVPGSEYKWRVRSSKGLTFSDWSDEAFFKVNGQLTTSIVIPKPSWPIGGAFVYSASTQLNWYLGALSTGLTFDVEYGIGALTGTPTISGITNLNVTINQLQPGQTYLWKVRSNQGSIYSDWSTEQSFKTIANAIAATTPILSWPIGGITVYVNSPTLSWFLISGSTGVTYELQYSTSASMSNPTTVSNIVSQQFALMNLAPGITYYWRVRSFDGIVYSSNSTTASFVTYAGNSAIVPMTGSPSEGTEISSISPMLSWFIPTDGNIDKYEVQYSKKNDMKDAVTLITTKPAYTLGNLDKGSTYFWRVRSLNSEGEKSDYSEIQEFTTTAAVTDIADKELMPSKFELNQNFPNPFNPTTTIEFSIAESGYFTLEIFNILGEKIAVLMKDNFNPGKYKAVFDAGKFSSGIYFYKLSGNNVNIIRKMMLLK